MQGKNNKINYEKLLKKVPKFGLRKNADELMKFKFSLKFKDSHILLNENRSIYINLMKENLNFKVKEFELIGERSTMRRLWKNIYWDLGELEILRSEMDADNKNCNSFGSNYHWKRKCGYGK